MILDALTSRLETRISRVVTNVAERHGTEQDVRAVCLERADPTRLASHVARTIERYVKALLDRPFRRAVLERPCLAERWPLGDGLEGEDVPVDEAAVLKILARYEPGVRRWPIEVAVLDLVIALEKTGNAKAKTMAKWMRAGDPAAYAGHDQDPTLGQHDQWLIEHARHKGVVPDDSPFWAWPPIGCAVIFASLRAVRDDARRPTVPIAAGKASRAALAVISQGPMGPWVDTQIRNETFELVWKGSPRPYQLALPFRGSFEASVIRGILQELHEDGLRDYLVLHRMAARAGRTGTFRWTWQEHRERTAYDRRIAQDNLRDVAAAAAVTSRLWKLKGAEVRQSVTRADGAKAWVRIGPFGLIDIPAAATMPDGSSLERAAIALNPTLYEGAHRDADQPNFALLPDEALRLDGRMLRLATLTALDMRYARDDGGVIVRTAGALWEYVHLRDGVPEPKEWSRADDALHHALDQLQAAGVIGGWTREPGPATPQAHYTLRPPVWWRDQVVLEVPPEMGLPQAQTPRTGAELKTWREKRGWTQAELAKRFKVNEKTIRRAEAEPDKPVGRSLAKATDEFRPEMGGVPGILPKGSNEG
jgi:DNA-binding XRE family transcriptional regulator